MTDPKTVFLPRSFSCLRSVELVAVVDPEPGLPPYVAAAIVVRGTNSRQQVETQALPVDELDAAPLQQLRQLLAESSAAPARLNLVADGSGRCGSRTWSLPGRRWMARLNQRVSDEETRSIEGFLVRVLRPFVQRSEPSARHRGAGQDPGMTTISLPQSSSHLHDVELLAVVDPAPGVPSFIAGAVVVRGEDEQGRIATEALVVDQLDAEPLQLLRELLANRGTDPVRITLVAHGNGRSRSRALALPGWRCPGHHQHGGGGSDTRAIELFLARVIRPYMQPDVVTVYLPRSYCSLRSVELIAVVDPTTGLPNYIAGAVVVRGENDQGVVVTQAIAVDELDAEPLQQLRQVLSDSGAAPARLDLVAQGDGRSSSMAWTTAGWPFPKHLQDSGGARATLAIEDFLGRVLEPYMQPEATV